MGVDAAGFYLSSAGGNQILIDLDLVDPVFSGAIEFAGQEFDVTDGGTSLNATIDIDLKDGNNDGRIRTSEISGDVVTGHFAGDARLDIGIDSANGQDGAAPIGADLGVDWHFANATINHNNDNSGFGNKPIVTFDNVTMDLGKFMENFISPVLDKINAVLDPIRPILDVLNARIGLLEDFPGGMGLFDATGDNKVTILDLLALASQVSGNPVDFGPIARFIELADKIADWTDFLSTQLFAGGDLNLGSFDLAAGHDIRALTFDLGNASINFGGLADSISGVISTLSGTGWNATDIGSGMTGAEILEDIATSVEFDLPILTDPDQIMNLLLGNDADLFALDLPVVDLAASGRIFTFPIFPFINIFADGSIGVTFDIDFGYSTRGLFDPALTPLDGFFIVDAAG